MQLKSEQPVKFELANPKRPGTASAMRYDKYKLARTVGEAYALGAKPGDLKHDFEKGYLEKLADSPPPDATGAVSSEAHSPALPTPPARRPATAGMGSAAAPPAGSDLFRVVSALPPASSKAPHFPVSRPRADRLAASVSTGLPVAAYPGAVAAVPSCGPPPSLKERMAARGTLPSRGNVRPVTSKAREVSMADAPGSFSSGGSSSSRASPQTASVAVATPVPAPSENAHMGISAGSSSSSSRSLPELFRPTVAPSFSERLLELPRAPAANAANSLRAPLAASAEPAVVPAAAPPSSSSSPHEESISSMLLAMGYSDQDTQRALRRSSSVEEAVEFLVTHPDEDPAPPSLCAAEATTTSSSHFAAIHERCAKSETSMTAAAAFEEAAANSGDDDASDVSDSQILAACAAIESRGQAGQSQPTPTPRVEAVDTSGPRPSLCSTLEAYAKTKEQRLRHAEAAERRQRLQSSVHINQQEQKPAEERCVNSQVAEELNQSTEQEESSCLKRKAEEEEETAAEPSKRARLEEDVIGEPSEDGDPCSGQTLTLRLRLGTIVVKQEPDSEDDDRQSVAELDSECGGDSPLVTLRCRLGVDTRLKLEGAVDSGAKAFEEAVTDPGQSSSSSTYLAPSDEARRFPARDIRELLQARPPQQAAEPEQENKAASEVAEAEAERQRQAEQFEAAQTASYDCNRIERQERAARDRELVSQGDLAPIEALDQELMAAIFECDAMFEWLQNSENRGLLFRYLELRCQAIRWYHEPAEAYFAAKRQHLVKDILQGEGAALVMTPFLQEEKEKVEAELYAMPEKGRFVPRLFAPNACMAVGGGCVEVFDD